MTSAELDEYILDHYAAESSHSFDTDRSVTVYSRSDNKKWFAATKNIGYRYLGIGREGRIDILNVSVNPRLVATLREREGFRPAWRMNRNRWVTILLDGSVPDDEIRSYLDMSYKFAGRKGGKGSGRK